MAQAMIVLIFVLAAVAWQVQADCASGCTGTEFKAYSKCLTNCGTNVAVTNCDCSSTNCNVCSGGNSCCQTCCQNQCKQSSSSCTGTSCDCNAIMCNSCSASMVQTQSSCCNTCCKNRLCDCAATNCNQCGGSSCCNQCCSQSVNSNCGTCTGTQQGSCCQEKVVVPVQTLPAQVAPPIPVVVQTPVQNYPVPSVNVSAPHSINIAPATINVTLPNITVVINTSPVSQVSTTQYGSNASLALLPGALTVRGGDMQLSHNCSSENKCCRVMALPRPCTNIGYGMMCPRPEPKIGCGAQCNQLVSQYAMPPPPPPPPPSIVPVPYPVVQPQYQYVPQPIMVQPPQYFCANNCIRSASWPFMDCSTAFEALDMTSFGSATSNFGNAGLYGGGYGVYPGFGGYGGYGGYGDAYQTFPAFPGYGGYGGFSGYPPMQPMQPVQPMPFTFGLGANPSVQVQMGDIPVSQGQVSYQYPNTPQNTQ